MNAKIGDVIITCPSCGASLQTNTTLHSITVYSHSVVASFNNVSIDHECKGRD